ncbi:MAG TPA: hypothetical protein VH796_06945 [Nitrososphaeraceae archaeon]|jgi:hypothetical protein
MFVAVYSHSIDDEIMAIEFQASIKTLGPNRDCRPLEKFQVSNLNGDRKMEIENYILTSNQLMDEVFDKNSSNQYGKNIIASIE